MTQRAITVLLQAVTGPYEAAMGRAAGATKAFGVQASGVATTAKNKAAPALANLSTMLIGGAGLAYGLTYGADLLMDYETALIGVGKTSNLSGDDLAALGDELTELSKRVDGSAEDMLAIAQNAAQLGVASEDLVEFTEVVAGIASATNLTADQAATDFARLANIMDVPIGNVERLGSATVDLGNNMATTETEIVDMATRIAAAGKSSGLTADEVLALAGAASSLALEAEAGGSAISKTLTEINTAVLGSTEDLYTIAEVANVTADDFAAAWRDRPAEAFQLFLAGLQRVREEGGDVQGVLHDLGMAGLRQADALVRLAGDADGVTDAFDMASDAYRDNTALADEVAAANASAAVAFDNLKDSTDDLFRTILGGEEGASGLATVFNSIGREVDEAAVEMEYLWYVMTTAPWDVVKFDVWESDIRNTTDGLEGFRAEAERVVPKINHMAEAADGVPPVLSDVEQAADDLGIELDDTVGSMGDLQDKFLELISPAFAFKAAQDRVKAAQDALNTAVDEHGPASDVARGAALDLSYALLEEEAAAYAAEGSFEAADGAVRGLEGSNRLAGEAADAAADKLGDMAREAGDLSGNYDVNVRFRSYGYDNVIAQARTVSSVASRAWQAARPGGPQRAAGGGVTTGVPHLVGELGPELFVPDTPGEVVPHGETARMLTPAPNVPYNGGSDSGPRRTGGDVHMNGNVYVRDATDIDALSRTLAARVAAA